MTDLGTVSTHSTADFEAPTGIRRLRRPYHLRPDDEVCALAGKAALVSTGETTLGALWRALLSRPDALLASWVDANGCHVLLSDAGAAALDAEAKSGAPGHVMFDRILTGDQQKLIALERGLAPATVSQYPKRLGFDCSSGRVPVLLVMASRATALDRGHIPARLTSFRVRNRTYSVVSVPRPYPALLGKLTTTERELVGMLLERRSNAEMALSRKTSIRTIANQISSVLRKLKVAGRNGVVSLLATRWCEEWPHAPRALEQRR